MSNKLYVGNLPWSVREEQLRELFAEFGDLEDVFVMVDKFSGRSKGFGFVTFASEESAAAAKEAMHDKDLEGRPLNVDFARPKED